MKKISLEKVVLNMGVGRSGEAIETAKKALDQISGKRSCAREAKETQRDWGRGRPDPARRSTAWNGKLGRSLGVAILQTRDGQMAAKKA